MAAPRGASTLGINENGRPNSSLICSIMTELRCKVEPLPINCFTCISHKEKHLYKCGPTYSEFSLGFRNKVLHILYATSTFLNSLIINATSFFQ